MDAAHLKEILALHARWLSDPASGKQADLRGADLYRANLYAADLSGANLYAADLRGANLHGADLYEADLRGADLRWASLYAADLSGAYLSGANLYGADLWGAAFTVELRGALNLRQTHHDPDQVPYLSLSETWWTAV